MTRATVVDYSWARPDPTCLRSHGYVGVMRYLSWDRSGKNLTRAEAQKVHAAGLWIGLNWEGAGNWSEFASGASGGTRAGTEARRQCNAIGAPASVPIFASVDYQAPRAHWQTIGAWLAAFRTASHARVGVYGQGDLGDWLLDRGAVEWVWQTNATGWGGVAKRAVLIQQLWTTACGADVDPNILAGDPRDWAWLPESHRSEEDDMTPDQIAQAADTNDQAHKAALHAAGAQATAKDALDQARKAALLAASADAKAKENAEALARIEKLLTGEHDA